MNNNDDFAAGFAWRHADRGSKSGNWLLDLAVALAIAMLAAMLGMAGEAHAQDAIQLTGVHHTALISVTMGKSQDVRTDTSFSDVTVGDPDIADVNPLTDRTLSILGKKIGTTRVSVYNKDKTLVGIFDIEVTYDISRLSHELKVRFPRSDIHVSAVNGRIMLSGKVVDATTLDQAVTIARQFGPDIINTVSVMSPQQVMLQVRFVEILRNAGRELGVQWNSFGTHNIVNIGSQQPASNLPITSPTSSTAITEAAAGVLSGASPFGFALGRIISGKNVLDVALNALEQKGDARTLAEPNLAALSGDTASFLAGGEYPIPVSSQYGQITVAYKKYGVGLAFTPTVLGHGVINMKIQPEVSQLDWTNAVPIGQNILVPALTVRRASTTVELHDGQSFMIGGLLLSNNRHNIDQLPWIGNVPVLGALFSSKSYQNNETDLVIIVTPHLVRPARPGDVVKVPTDDTRPPNDRDFFLLGKDEITPAEQRVAAADGQPFTGHMLDMPMRESNAAIH